MCEKHLQRTTWNSHKLLYTEQLQEKPAHTCCFNMKCNSNQWCWELISACTFHFKSLFPHKTHKEAWNTRNSHSSLYFFSFSLLQFPFSAGSCYCLLLQWSIKFNFIWLTLVLTPRLYSLSAAISCYRAREAANLLTGAEIYFFFFYRTLTSGAAE